MTKLIKKVLATNILFFIAISPLFADENSIISYIKSNIPFYKNDASKLIASTTSSKQIELKQKAIADIQYVSKTGDDSNSAANKQNIYSAINYLNKALKDTSEKSTESLQIRLSLFSLELDLHDYKTADQTIVQLSQDFPNEPVVHIYAIAYLDLLKLKNYNLSLQSLKKLKWSKTDDFIKTFKIIKNSFYLQINTNANQIQIENNSPTVIIINGYNLNPDGTMNDILIKRLQKGLEVHQRYPNAKIIVAGGRPKLGVTESYRMRQWLIKNGVPSSSIIQEDQSSSTVWGAIDSFKILESLKPKVKDIILVTSASDIRRTNSIFEQENLNTKSNFDFHNVVSGVKGYNIMMPISEDERASIIKDTLRMAGIWQMPGMVF
ncbi:YdcF family protein [Francisella sp. 19X1-34]|uniref:YdcF family protein n=1 Tax=Francisella sp. 19X1-34 TaxID=3087177 RepID=UPI002E37CBB1|nr:YdcF family protein [Francisella sp. 19X1-34]MED7789167.1 YdcF family protein [Francisella sp. 19X1-34]